MREREFLRETIRVMNVPQNPVLGRIRKNLSVELEERRKALAAQGKRLFDFGLGDPKEPTPAFIREALRAAVPEVSQYPSAAGSPAFRAACAGYVKRRFAVQLDPETQVAPCAGAKEAIFHLPLAFAGDPARRKVVMPDPGYPTYDVGARFAGLEPVPVPLTARNRFLIEPEALGEALLRETLIFWVSYPHNPTGAIAPRDYLERVGRAAVEHGFIVASDECYADIYFGEPPPSMLEVQTRERHRDPQLLQAERDDGLPERLHGGRPGAGRRAEEAAEPSRARVAGVRAGGCDGGLERRRPRGRAA